MKDLDFGSCRVIHVGDRGCDNYRFLTACARHGHSYVIRAKHDRKAHGIKRLWPWLKSQPVAGRYELQLPAGAHRKARVAKLTVRFAPVSIPPPVNDPRSKDAPPLKMWAVLVALLTKRPVDALTAEECLHCMAHQGSWLGRKNDPPPGWRALWKGWHKLAPMAHLLSVTKGKICV